MKIKFAFKKLKYIVEEYLWLYNKNGYRIFFEYMIQLNNKYTTKIFSTIIKTSICFMGNVFSLK